MLCVAASHDRPVYVRVVCSRPRTYTAIMPPPRLPQPAGPDEPGPAGGRGAVRRAEARAFSDAEMIETWLVFGLSPSLFQTRTRRSKIERKRGETRVVQLANETHTAQMMHRWLHIMRVMLCRWASLAADHIYEPIWSDVSLSLLFLWLSLGAGE